MTTMPGVYTPTHQASSTPIRHGGFGGTTTLAEIVLVVEDEQPVRELLLTWLDEAGYETCFGVNGVDGLKQLYDHRPDLVVADVMMPEMDGFEFCRLVREVSKAPIMILSGLGKEAEKIKGLDLGADDYVVKPVGMDEFLARVGALLRRRRWSDSEPAEENRYEDSQITIFPERHEVWVRGDKVDLTPIEFRLLSVLTEWAGKTCSLDEIRRQVWESPHYSAEVVRWHIASLRNKIEPDPDGSPQRIVTVWGVGYRYEVPGNTAEMGRG
ncbi:MAG: response regulator transcription factor [SAR202 cluster bacterium]|jgi:DNA-binding response OmpR family regulator|nr:response regulator transcription factor [SAR202 cluster bacterium]MDP6512596.1 response regulator transcription factor [SAR202 cluster bacterium]MDP6716600.1 response regulator transcription factor [SAR202 cluster bacterium]